LNGLTAQVQNFATGTNGTDFNIESASTTHVFNLPTASGTNRGALSSTDWTTFNGKVGGTGASGQVAFWNGTSSQTGDNGLFWDNTNKRLGVGTNAPDYNFQVNGSIRFGSSTTLANNTYFDNTTFRLGIGTQTPTRKLEVIENASGLVANFRSTTGNISAISLSNNASTADQIRIGSNGASLALSTNFTQKFAIFNTGNVLIQDAGTFTDAGFRLDVNGTARVQGQLSLGVTGTAGRVNFARSSNGTMIGGIYTSGNDLVIENLSQALIFSAVAVERMRLSPTNGNLLINTTTDAGFRLDVNGTARVTGAITGTSTLTLGQTGTAGEVILNRSSNGAVVGGIRADSNGAEIGGSGYSSKILVSNGGARIQFFTTTERMRLEGGNLLIGTTTDVASSKLTIESTTQGVLFPRMTTTQKNAIASPATGLVVYDTTLNKLAVYTGAAWETITSI
jgi:hypothetical protein